MKVMKGRRDGGEFHHLLRRHHLPSISPTRRTCSALTPRSKPRGREKPDGGFAVVAEEVRKLAEESNRAAGEVKKIVDTLEKHAKESVSSMVRVDSVVTEVAGGARNAWDRLSEALSEIEKINDVLQTIAAATQEQAAASQEAAHGIDNATKSVT